MTRVFRPLFAYLGWILLILSLLGCSILSRIEPTPSPVKNPITETVSQPINPPTSTPTTTKTNTPPSPTSTPTPTSTFILTPAPLSFDLPKVAELGEGLLPAIYRSPDGKIVVTVEDEMLVWADGETLNEIGSLDIGKFEVFDITFSPNNKLMAMQGILSIEILDLDQGNFIARTATDSMGGVGSPVFTSDSQLIVFLETDQTTGGAYHRIGLWDIANDALVHFFPVLSENRSHRMTPPDLSPNGKWIAAGYHDSTNNLVYIYDLESGEARYVLEGHVAEIYAVDFSPSGYYLASGSSDGIVRLWNPSTGKLEQVVTGLPDAVNRVEFSSDGRSLEIGVGGTRNYTFDLASGELYQSVREYPSPDPLAVSLHQQGHLDDRWAPVMTFSQDGNSLAIGTRNALIWDTSLLALQAALENPGEGQIHSLAFRPHTNQVVAFDTRGLLLLWDAQSGDLLSSVPISLKSFTYRDQALAVSPDGKYLAFVNDDTVEIWDLDTLTPIRELHINQYDDNATAVSFFDEGTQLAVVLNWNERVQVWDFLSGDLTRQLDLPNPNDTQGDAVIQGHLLARIMSPNQVEIWHLEEEKYVRLEAELDYRDQLQLSPDGKLLVGVADERLYFWDTDIGQLIYKMEGEFEAYSSDRPVISPDNSTLAAFGNGKVTLWDIQAIANALEMDRVQEPSADVWANGFPTATPQPTAINVSQPETVLHPLAISSTNAAQVAELTHFGEGTIEEIIWSSDGLTFTLIGSSGVYQYDTETLTKTPFRETEAWIYDYKILQDGRKLAVGTDNNRVWVWDIETSEMLVDLPGGGEPKLSPDGELVVYQDANGDLRSWDIAGEKPVARMSCAPFYSAFSAQPVFSPDGNFVVAIQAGTYNASLRIWDVQTGAIVNALGGPDNDITDFSYSADGQYLVGAAGGSAWIWDVEPGMPPDTITLYAGKPDGNLVLYGQKVTAVALSPNNQIVAVGTSEKDIWLYQRASQTVLAQLEGHLSEIRLLSFSPDGEKLLSVDADGNLYLWETSTGEQLQTSQAHNGAITGMIFQSNNNLIAWQGNTAWVFDTENDEVIQTTRIYSGEIMAANPVGDWLAVYSPYRTSLWDLETGGYWQTLEGEAEDVPIDHYDEGEIFRGFNAATFSADGSLLTVAGTGGTWLYDGHTGQLVEQYRALNLIDTLISRDNGWIASCHLYGFSSWWVVESRGTDGVPVDLDEHYCRPGWLAFSPNSHWMGMIIKRWGEPYQVGIWNLSTHEQIYHLPFSEQIPLSSLAFNPDERLVAIGQADGRIFIVDLSTSEVVAALKEHTGSVDHLTFSQDGLYLASGSNDGTVRIWGVP